MRPKNRRVWVREDSTRHVWGRATAMRDAGYAGYVHQHQVAAVKHPHHVVEQTNSVTVLEMARAQREAHEDADGVRHAGGGPRA